MEHDPSNPHRHGTWLEGEHDRIYTTHRVEERQRADEFAAEMSKPIEFTELRPGASSGAWTRGGPWTGGGSRRAASNDRASFWTAVGIVVAFGWLGDRLGSYWTAGFVIAIAIAAVAGLVSLVKAFFRTKLGETVAVILQAVAMGAVLLLAGWGAYQIFGL
jgi:hypothetical protein